MCDKFSSTSLWDEPLCWVLALDLSHNAESVLLSSFTSCQFTFSHM